MRCPILLAILMAFTSFTNLSAQTWVEFGVYDVGSWNGSQWLPPDGRIGQATDIQAIINHLSGGFPTPPNHAGTTNPTFDVTSSFADIYGLQRDNLISPLDILWIVNHMNLKYHQNANLPCDVNGSGAVTPLDALLVINYINARSPVAPPISNVADRVFPLAGYPTNLVYTLRPVSSGTVRYLDVTGDHVVTNVDALTVINWLNTH